MELNRIHNNGRSPAPTSAEAYARHLMDRIKQLETIVDAQHTEIMALCTEARQTRAYTGTDVHIAALHTALKERNEMIAGLRETIKRLEGKG